MGFFPTVMSFKLKPVKEKKRSRNAALNPSVWYALKDLPTKQSCSLSWIKNQSYGSFVDEKGPVTRAHQSACILQEQVPSLSSLWNIAFSVNGIVPAAPPAIYAISPLFLFPHFFILSSQKPWRCLWPVSAPSVMWVFFWVCLAGVWPPLRAPHTWLGGLPDLALAPWRRAFLAQGKACMPLSPHQWERVWGHYFRGACAIWSSCKPQPCRGAANTQGPKRHSLGI